MQFSCKLSRFDKYSAEARLHELFEVACQSFFDCLVAYFIGSIYAKNIKIRVPKL